MRQTRFLRRSALVTLVLFAVTAATPLSAAELGLMLETTPAVEALSSIETGDLDTVTSTVDVDAAATVRIDPRAAADWRSVDGAALATAARQDDPDVGRSGNRTWRWLKRYWWVPVLVGGAIALAVQDDTPDDGEDDD